MKPGDKLYIVTRKDISPGYQAVQSIHAMRQFSADHPEIDQDWFITSNYLALLSVANESEICRLLENAQRYGVRFSVFREPDLGDQITAIALEPGRMTMNLCKKLSLALQSQDE